MMAMRKQCPQNKGKENKKPASESKISSLLKCLAWLSRVSEGYREVFENTGFARVRKNFCVSRLIPIKRNLVSVVSGSCLTMPVLPCQSSRFKAERITRE